MRFAGNIFNEGVLEEDDESLLTSYFPDLKNVYRPKFKNKVATPVSQPRESASSSSYS